MCQALGGRIVDGTPLWASQEDMMQRAAEVTVRPAATSTLTAQASLGDQAAWDQLVERYGGLVWSVARAHGLPPEDAADVSQVTWLLLTQHLGSLGQPEQLEAWLLATATREAFRMCRLRGHHGALVG
jgi:DNA-directed RNA polymerase specialized sigma24 family protein